MATALARTPAAPPAAPKSTVSAVEMGARQREISVSEFFTKNRHLLGFDNPRKALLTCVKEAVDNALDAAEEAGILPDVVVKLEVVGDQRDDAAGQPGHPLPRDGHRQRPRHRPPADPADLRQAPLRLEVPPAAHEPGPAGDRHLGGRDVRPAHDRQARADHLAHRRPGGGPLLRGADRHQEERAADLREQEDRLGASARHAGDAGDRGALPEGPRLGGRVPRADGDRQPARAARLPHAGRRDAQVSADDPGAAAPAAARSSRTPTASSSACCCGCCKTPRATRWPGSSPATSAGSRPRSPQEICKTAKLSPDARPRNIHGEDGGGALQGDPDHQDHGAAVQLHLAHRREGAPPRPVQADQGRLLHGGDPAAGGLPRQPVHHRGGAGLRQGPGSRGGRRRGAGRPAGRGEEQEDDDELARVIRYANRVPLLYQQSACATFKAALETAWRNYGVDPVAGRAARRAHGDLRPHGLGVGAVHQRVQGSDRRLRRDPQGDQARAAGVRSAARRILATARAGQERVPAPQHLRAVHRGGRGGLRPSQGRQAPQGEAEDPAAEDRRQADRRRPDRRDPGQGRRPGRPAALDHRHARRAGGRGAGAAGATASGEVVEAHGGPGSRDGAAGARQGGARQGGLAQGDQERQGGRRTARRRATRGEATPAAKRDPAAKRKKR